MFSLLKFLGVITGANAMAVKEGNDLYNKIQSPEYRIGYNNYQYMYGSLPRMKGYNRVWEFDLIHQKVREVKQEIPKEEIMAYFHQGNTYNRSIRLAQEDWLKRNYPEYVKAGYNFIQFVLEYARKTVFDNGYMPSCQQIGGCRNIMFDKLYSGKIYNNLDQVDFIHGIPNQQERKRLEEIDKTHKFSY